MTIPQIIYVSIASSVAGIIAGVVLFWLIRKKLYIKHFRNIYGRTIYQIALDYDYYLINDFILRFDDDHTIHIDHVLVGDKYIFLFKDRYYRGAIEGKEADKSWFYYRKHERVYIDNPINKNYQRLQRFSYGTGLDEKMLISIVIVNNDCLINPFMGSSKTNYLVPLCKVKKLVKAIESRPVPKFNEKQVQYTVNDLARINKKNHK